MPILGYFAVTAPIRLSALLLISPIWNQIARTMSLRFSVSIRSERKSNPPPTLSNSGVSIYQTPRAPTHPLRGDHLSDPVGYGACWRRSVLLTTPTLRQPEGVGPISDRPEILPAPID